MPAATLLFFIVFLLFIDRFYQFSFNGLFRVEWEKIKSQKPRWLQFCRLENLSVSIQFRLRLCIYLFNWFNSVWGIFLCFFLLETSFFLFKYSLPQEKLFPYWNYCESTFGEMNSRSWCRTRDVPRLPVPNWWRRNREEEEGKEKVRQKRKKERKKIRERMKEEGGGCAFAERAGS